MSEHVCERMSAAERAGEACSAEEVKERAVQAKSRADERLAQCYTHRFQVIFTHSAPGASAAVLPGASSAMTPRGGGAVSPHGSGVVSPRDRHVKMIGKAPREEVDIRYKGQL